MMSTGIIFHFFLVALVAGRTPLERQFDDMSMQSDLCDAVESGNLEDVENVLDQGVDANEGCTFLNSNYPIGIAAQTGNCEIAEALINEGADVNTVEAFGCTALIYAAQNVDAEMMELLIENDADVNAAIIGMEGIDLDLGLDVLSLATAGYLREVPFMSEEEVDEYQEEYLDIIDLLQENCFDVATLGEMSKTRLASEGHQEAADHITEAAEKDQEGC